MFEGWTTTHKNLIKIWIFRYLPPWTNYEHDSTDKSSNVFGLFLETGFHFLYYRYSTGLWKALLTCKLTGICVWAFYVNFPQELGVWRGASHEEMSWCIFERFRYLQIWFELDALPNTHSLTFKYESCWPWNPQT